MKHHNNRIIQATAFKKLRAAKLREAATAIRDARASRSTLAHRLHLCLHPKLIKASKRSHIWLEMASALFAAIETHMRAFALVSILYLVVDLVIAIKSDPGEETAV